VASSGTSQVRLYDPAGKRLHVTGRKGQGPGEFVRIAWMGRVAGDTLLVFDAAFGA